MGVKRIDQRQSIVEQPRKTRNSTVTTPTKVKQTTANPITATLNKIKVEERRINKKKNRRMASIAERTQIIQKNNEKVNEKTLGRTPFVTIVINSYFF